MFQITVVLYTHYSYGGNVTWIEVTRGLAHRLGVLLLFGWYLSQSLSKTYFSLGHRGKWTP